MLISAHQYEGNTFFSSAITSRPDPEAHPLPIQYQKQFRNEKAAKSVKVATHLHLLPTLRIYGGMPTLPHASSWRGTSEKKTLPSPYQGQANQ